MRTEIIRRTVIAASLLLVAGGFLSGCACSAYKQALRAVRDTGGRIEQDIKPSDPGGEARKEAFHSLLEQLRSMDLGD